MSGITPIGCPICLLNRDNISRRNYLRQQRLRYPTGCLQIGIHIGRSIGGKLLRGNEPEVPSDAAYAGSFERPVEECFIFNDGTTKRPREHVSHKVALGDVIGFLLHRPTGQCRAPVKLR